MISYYLFFLSILAFISLSSSQLLVDLFNNTICSKIDIDQLYNFVNFEQLKQSVISNIKENPYPLNNTNILDSVIKNENPCPFREKVLLKMSRNEEITILIIGGSLTKGANVFPKEKRWSDILNNYMNSGWYKNNFKIINIAVGGWDINIWAQKLEEIAQYNPDLIITDFTVNEIEAKSEKLHFVYEAFVRALETIPKRPAVLFNIMFSLAFTDKKRFDTGILKYTINLKHSDELVAYYKYWKVGDHSKFVLDYHRIPSTNFRDIVYPDFFNPPDDLASIWTSFVHPNSTTHKYIADHIYNTLAYLIQDSTITNKCKTKINGNINPLNYCDRLSYIDTKDYDNRARPVCQYGTIMEKIEATTSINPIKSIDMNKSIWKYYDDSDGKFGWIYSNTDLYIKSLLKQNLKSFRDNLTFKKINKNYLLSFEINVNSALQITYLQSYSQNFSNFIFWFDDNISKTFFITTKWKPLVSLPSTCTIFFDPINIFEALTPVRFYALDLKKGKHILNILPLPTEDTINSEMKVKILGIKTC